MFRRPCTSFTQNFLFPFRSRKPNVGAILTYRLIATDPTQNSPKLSATKTQQFKKLHANVPAADQFLSIAEPQHVQDYINDLQDLQSTLSNQEGSMLAISEKLFMNGWCRLLNQKILFQHISLMWHFNDSKAELESRISKLAFSFLYPNQSPVSDHNTRVKAINSSLFEVGKTSPQPVAQSVKSTIVLEGFHHRYLHSESIVEPTLKTLNQFTKDWAPELYFAPYTSLIGPTMSGKTRLLRELSKHTCVVYICIRPPDSSGQPPRTAYPSKILLDIGSTNLHHQYELFLLAIIETVVEFFTKVNTGSTQERLEKWIDHSFPTMMNPGDPPFWTGVSKKMDNTEWRQSNSQRDSYRNFITASNNIVHTFKFINQNLKVLLAIDEARELHKFNHSANLSFFRIFRHVIQQMGTGSGFFSILADTTPTWVSNFNPPTHQDPSHRPGGKSQGKLYPPIYEIPTFDVNVTNNPPTDWYQLQSPFRLFSYGSPFWGVYVDNAKKNHQPDYSIVEELSRTALQKLLCSTDVAITPTSLTYEQGIALLGSTIQPQLLAGASHLNTELVSSHGAQCMYINPLRSMLISQYPSQFAYSSAANRLLASDDLIWIRCIEFLTFTTRQGYISPGDNGELVSRIILLRAMQETMKRKPPVDARNDPDKPYLPFGHSVRLEDFLLTLTGLTAEKQLKLGSITEHNKKKLLQNGQLFWNHFICVDHTPTSADLLRKLYRGLAVHCKPKQAGFDQIFTVYFQSTTTGPLNEESITFCGVQVKNEKQANNLKGDSHKWTPGYAGIKLKKRNPYLALFFSLRPEPKLEASKAKLKTSKPKISKLKTSKPTRYLPSQTRSPTKKAKQKIVNIPNGKTPQEDCDLRASLAFYGLDSFPFLSRDLIVALEELLNARPNMLSFHEKPSEHTRTYIKTLSPEVSSPDE